MLRHLLERFYWKVKYIKLKLESSFGPFYILYLLFIYIVYNLYYLHSFYYHDYKVLINDCLISRFYTSLLLGCKFCTNDVFNA